MAKKTLFMETTEVTPEKTAGEILGLLGSTPMVRRVTSSYSDTGEITGIAFGIQMGPLEHFYELPARVEPVYEALCKKKGVNPDWNLKETPLKAQAKRVAWRQLLRWTQAQLAMIETGMVAPQEVFQPYLLIHTPDGRKGTMYQLWIENELKQLPAPEAKEA